MSATIGRRYPFMFDAAVSAAALFATDRLPLFESDCSLLAAVLEDDEDDDDEAAVVDGNVVVISLVDGVERSGVGE